MKFGYLWFSLLGCLPMGVYAQEGISKDSIRLSEDSLKTIPGWQNISPDFSPSYAGTKGVEVDNLMDTLKVNTNVEWKLQKPFSASLLYESVSDVLWGLSDRRTDFSLLLRQRFAEYLAGTWANQPGFFPVSLCAK